MSLLGWIGLAAVSWIAVGVVVFCVREREAREAIGEFALALVVGPALVTVGVFLRAWAPRATPLSAEALALFARQTIGHTGLSKRERSAWLLSYRGHGLILVRRRGESTDATNSVGRRAASVREDIRRRRKP